ncbi:MAG: ABC transporter ATP-binding protein [Clostridia bacterium]|nr:ABC transporter ATP-binding protein [Clostridia bacterium]
MKRWIKYAAPYKKFFILGPLCMIIEVIGEALMPKLMSTVINGYDVGSLTIERSIITALLMILLAIMMLLGGVGGAYFGAKASVNFAADIRKDTYKKIQRFSFANIDRFSTGSLVTRLTNDVTQLQNFVNMLLRMALRAPGMMIGALIMSITINPSLATVFYVSIPLMLCAIGLIIGISFPRFKRMQTKIDRLNSTVQESVTNIRVVKSFVREKAETERFKKANFELKKSGLAAVGISILMNPVTTFFMNFTVIAVLGFGYKIVLGGDMLIGDLSAFITYVSQILFSIMMVTVLLMTSSRAIASANRIAEVLDEAIDLSDEKATFKDKAVEKGHIEFKNVSFRYFKNSEECVLDNINLTIPSGATVGIIGSTGCGKTTLVSMIPRLYDVDEGEVLIDGINVKDYSLFQLRESVGMVLQKNILFSGSVEDNLRWGDQTADNEALVSAAKSAEADRFISSFNEGYEKNIEQGGMNLSGGQKQRLCIARALLKRPKILILDDSTSAVDTATERNIRHALETNLSATTKIIIAQRISSVKNADLIVVMDDGKITGIGSHDQLLADNEEYKEIYYSQIEKEDA